METMLLIFLACVVMVFVFNFVRLPGSDCTLVDLIDDWFGK